MKIAYFGFNGLSSCLPAFKQHGHDISVIFTGNDELYADQIIDFSQQNRIPIVFSKPDAQYLNNLITAGVELFFSAEYPWRIPIPASLKYAINLHPTLLPFGRGPTPISYLLLNDAGHCGITLHKMIDNIDEGDILLQSKIELDSQESFDTLTAKIHLEAPLLLDKLLSSLEKYYENSLPQGSGTYWPSLTKEEQTIDWNTSVKKIVKQSRAFGSLGTYSLINSKPILITAVEGVLLKHTIEPGTIITNNKMQLVIAVSDGIICIAKTSLIFL